MLDEDDSFYKQLPFTLSADQTKPNYVIFGTGLQQCLLAAHYSKVKMKPGLIIDLDRTYGSCLKTVTIKQLYALSINKVKINLYEFFNLNSFKETNQKFYQNLLEHKLHRGYNIDLEPNFFFGSSITCQMLKDADMDKYMDFRLVHNMLHYDGKGFKNVPLSKGKIFQSKDLGLLQKKLLLNTFHSLSQIYNKYMNVEYDQNSTKQFDKQFGQVDQKIYSQFIAQKEQPFIKFMQKITKNNQKIMNYIIYILCNYQYNYKNYNQIPQHAQQDYKLSEFIKRFGKFVKSCGVYGECPYLYVDNGIGDVPQAYSRIASIYLSTYILHPKIEIHKIELPQPSPNGTDLQQSTQPSPSIKIHTNLSPSTPITTSHIYYGPTFYSQKFSNQNEYSRQYTLRTIVLAKKLGTQQDCPSIIYLPDVKQHANPVYLFMLDDVSHTCPEGYVLYQFETVLGDKWQHKEVEDKVAIYIEVLGITRGEEFRNSVQFVTTYIRQKRYPNKQKNSTQLNQFETILKDHSGIDLDSHFLNFKEIVGEHQCYFKKDKNQKNYNEDEFAEGGNQTLGLIQRLHAIDLNKQEQQNEEKQQNNQAQQVQKEGTTQQPQQKPKDQNYQKQTQDKVAAENGESQKKTQQELEQKNQEKSSEINTIP